jgi:hypothetical protein
MTKYENVDRYVARDVSEELGAFTRVNRPVCTSLHGVNPLDCNIDNHKYEVLKSCTTLN